MPADSPKFPQVRVQLFGIKSDPNLVVGATRSAMKRAGLPAKAIDNYSREVAQGPLEHVLEVTRRTISVS